MSGHCSCAPDSPLARLTIRNVPTGRFRIVFQFFNSAFYNVVLDYMVNGCSPLLLHPTHTHLPPHFLLVQSLPASRRLSTSTFPKPANLRADWSAFMVASRWARASWRPSIVE